ncbi:MAG: hypothetical protein U9N61_02685 [Euryarchaeota archaeon]|nr:hypothetical protein [Euryarchaeota archaeon]
MNDIVKEVLSFLAVIVDKYGTKFLVALAAIGGVVYLAFLDKLGWPAAIGIGIVTVAYFIGRHLQEINKKG